MNRTLAALALTVFACQPPRQQQLVPSGVASDTEQVTLSAAAWAEDVATMRRNGATAKDVAAYRLFIAQGLSRTGAMKYAKWWADDLAMPELVCTDYQVPPAVCRESPPATAVPMRPAVPN